MKHLHLTFVLLIFSSQIYAVNFIKLGVGLAVAIYGAQEVEGKRCKNSIKYIKRRDEKIISECCVPDGKYFPDEINGWDKFWGVGKAKKRGAWSCRVKKIEKANRWNGRKRREVHVLTDPNYSDDDTNNRSETISENNEMWYEALNDIHREKQEEKAKNKTWSDIQKEKIRKIPKKKRQKRV